MITVAGVTFSLTILAVSYATSHFGPRLLDNFMRDRANQLTLGTFVSTFLYCLLVLRTVRSSNHSINTGLQTDVFVPHISILIAIALTLVSVGVLIYFIHHIPESIHISNVLNRISRQLSCKIEELYPESLGDPLLTPAEDVLSSIDDGYPVRCRITGYLQGIDEIALLNFATEADAVLQLLVRPGDYLLEGEEIAKIRFHQGSDGDARMREDGLHAAMAIGIARTPTQDMYFLVNQFVEVAARALSPGVNDPFTAMQCIDQLAKAMVELSGRSIPSRFRMDSAGELRIVTTEPSWADIVDQAFGRLLPYVQADQNVTRHLKSSIQRICGISNNLELNKLLCEVSGQLDQGDARPQRA